MAVVSIPITKAKASVDIDTDRLPPEVYREAVILGLKHMANHGPGVTKVTKEHYPAEEELKAAAMACAEAQVEKMYSGEIKLSGEKKEVAKGPNAREISTEAMRLARNLVKDLMKREGIKVSHVASSEITTAAKAVLAEQPDLLDQAKANVEERSKTQIKVDIKALVKTDPKKVAAAEKAAAAKKAKSGTLSATQAGKVKKRPQAQVQAH